MNTKPILFSGPMVRAILDGSKTQTRRIIKPGPPPCQTGDRAMYQHLDGWRYSGVHYPSAGDFEVCPYGQPGDQLWVKETHLPKASGIIYRADFDPLEAAGLGGMYGGWKPSIFCRREYSRITLEIVSVRVERLQGISEPDAWAEGVNWKDHAGLANYTARKLYRQLWESINGPGSWDANPYVWVVEFRRVQP